MMLQIRNMESERCIMLVRNKLNILGLSHSNIELGKVELKGTISEQNLKILDLALKESGLEILYNKEHVLIGKIKAAIEQMIILSDDLPKPHLSVFISNKVKRDYTYLSNLFSASQGITIEKYIITRKIGRVKELLIYDQLSLNDIAYKLQYSSVAHLSSQFKKLTGLTPSVFRRRYQAGEGKINTNGRVKSLQNYVI